MNHTKYKFHEPLETFLKRYGLKKRFTKAMELNSVISMDIRINSIKFLSDPIPCAFLWGDEYNTGERNMEGYEFWENISNKYLKFKKKYDKKNQIH
jgi:hypothetical protein